ncbi:MAG: hypothetical protein ABSE84_07935 [Isosphaeraceae bacterium]|jgi:hypothetical protein
MSGRKWTPAEDRKLRKQYRTTATIVLARRLGRTLRSTYQRALVLGVSTRWHKVTAAEIRTIRRMAKAGYCNRCIGRATGHERHCIARWRNRLDLPKLPGGSVDSCQTCKAAVRAKTAEQLKKAGLPSLAYLRIETHRRFARQSGWPEDLRLRAVQILNALWEHGPMTRRQIAAAVGMPWKGTRKSLHSNDPEGSYLAHLIRRGLVVVMQRANVVRGQGKGHSTNIYALPVWLSPDRREDTEDDNGKPKSGRRRGPGVPGAPARAKRSQDEQQGPGYGRAAAKRHVLGDHRRGREGDHHEPGRSGQKGR